MSAQAALFGHFHQKSFNVETLRRSGHFSQRCLNWVKLRRTQYEHMFSALPSNSDIARRSRHVSNVPIGDIETNSAFAKIAVSQLLESCLLQAQYGKRYCALRT